MGEHNENVPFFAIQLQATWPSSPVRSTRHVDEFDRSSREVRSQPSSSLLEPSVLALDTFFSRTASISQSIPTKVDSCLRRSPCHRNPTRSMSIRSQLVRTRWLFVMPQIRNVSSRCTKRNRDDILAFVLSDPVLRHQWQTDWRRQTCVSRCK